MESLNVCPDWVAGHGYCCQGACGRRHPRWQGNEDLFYAQICHRFFRHELCGYRGCRRFHYKRDEWEAKIRHMVATEDTAWDWTRDEGPGTPRDKLSQLLLASTSVSPETVVEGMLQLVRGDLALEGYLLEVRAGIHSWRAASVQPRHLSTAGTGLGPSSSDALPGARQRTYDT